MCQKKRASLKRARSTRSLPWRNEAVGIAVGVQHREEVRRSLPFGVFQREVLLVIAHHRDQHFFGKREKFGIEAAENDRREFRQVHDRVEQGLSSRQRAPGMVRVAASRALRMRCSRAAEVGMTMPLQVLST